MVYARQAIPPSLAPACMCPCDVARPRRCPLRRFVDNQLANKKTRRVLDVAFGEEWSEQYMTQVRWVPYRAMRCTARCAWPVLGRTLLHGERSPSDQIRQAGMDEVRCMPGLGWLLGWMPGGGT